MQRYALEIDDFEDSNYTLLSLHTGLEDYKLAYLLNQALDLFFCKSKNLLEMNQDGQKAFFSVYECLDENQLCDWYLISNKHQGFSSSSVQTGLFGGMQQQGSKTSYLIPERKNADYFLKIEGDFDASSVRKSVQSVNKIQQIITSYAVDLSTLKSREVLIF
jgi:hypothetical protein